MPFKADDDLPTKFPTPDYMTLDNFKRGVVTLVDKSRTPRNALIQADNLFLVEDGQPQTRPGLGWFGSALPNDSGTKIGSATTTGAPWANSANVLVTDNTYATIANTATATIYITGHNFTVPTNATIVGVEIFVKGNGANATATARQVAIALTKDGATIAGTQTTVTLNQTTDTTQTVGSATFLHGTTLTPAEVNASTFGSVLRKINTDAQQRSVDSVQMKVYYTIPSGIDGFDYFDFGGTLHLVAAYGGSIYRSVDHAATWEFCTGGSLTAGKNVSFNQNGAFLYISAPGDNLLRYDGTTTLQTYTVLTTPAAPTIAATGLAGSQYTVYYKVAAVNKVGFSLASATATQSVGQPRSNWDNTANYLKLTLPTPQATQERADIYYSEDNVNFYYLDSIVSSAATPNVTYQDNGKAVVVPSTLAPTGNTSQGPKVAILRNVGSRMLGVGDPTNRYRIWFTGTGQFSGSFSSAYDGGYLDWQPGGKEIPVDVEDYRDGKGSPLATIWCDSADGQGSVLQMSFDTLTIQDISITVPSAFRLPGSRGTPAPGSVVNVLNDYMFYNSQAIYNLGNARNMPVPILSTDELSANIRPTVKQISSAAESKIVSVYFDAKVLFSVPFASTDNNTTMLYDTERRAWLPTAFTVGFKKFLKYTSMDSNGNKYRKLLAIKPGDNRLTEINNNIVGDYGVAFQTNAITGLYPTSKNRFEHQFTEETEVEVSQAQGQINVEVLGIDRTRGYSSIKTIPINLAGQTTTTGWDTYSWDTMVWDNTAGTTPIVYAESSTKKYTSIQRELNAIQWRIYTDKIDARYILRTLQAWGTPTEAGKPSPWRIK